MSRFNKPFKDVLDTKGTKIDWSGAFGSSLGNNRRLRCFRDANANATTPEVSGTEFLNMASTGPLTITAGNITGFGVLSNTTIRQAADLSSGSCVLVLEGNGNSVIYTLGLSGSGKDFILSKNPTGSVNEGYAFAPGSGMKAPRLLPSGTGPNPGTITATTPTVVKLYDWTNPASPVLVGSGTFSEATRQDNWVYESAELSAEIGDVAMYTLPTIKWNSAPANQKFELGGLLLVANKYNTDTGVQQLEQMLLSFKPLDRWANYPFMDTYVKAQYPVTGTDGNGIPNAWGACSNTTTNDSTYPPPFKIVLEAADGTVVYTHEMKAFYNKPAGPINGPEYSQARTKDEPLIPHFNCGMMLPWQNIRTKVSTNKNRYHAGVNSFTYTGRHTKEPYNSNACIPLIDAYNQINGHNHWYVMGQYPMKEAYYNASGDKVTYIDVPYMNAYSMTPRDPDAFNSDYLRDSYGNYRTTGYKYQPGSISGHDWKSGNGGVRFDRAACSAPMTIFASDQNWIRPEGNVPIRDLIEEFGLAYFNHSNHWIRNLQTFEGLDKQASLNGDMVFASAYYGGGPYGALGSPRGPQLTVDLIGPGSGDGRRTIHNDGSGRMPWGGWQRDSLHSYATAGWWALMLNSPMHAIAAKHDFDTQWMASLGGASPTYSPKNFFMVREQAWRWLHYTMAWKLGTQHPLGYSRQEIEARFQIELETVYDVIMKPAFIDNSPDAYSKSVRNFGVGFTNDNDFAFNPGGSLGLYLVHVMIMMRQFNLWSVMKAKSSKCQFTLEKMVACLDKITIDYALDTKMRDAYYHAIAPVANPTAADIPNSWADQAVMMDSRFPVLASTVAANQRSPIQEKFQSYQDFFKIWNNGYNEPDGNPHMYMQWMKARKVFFPEYPNARVDAAIAKVQTYYDAFDAYQTTQSRTGYYYLMYPMAGVLNAPAIVGPN